MAYGKVPWLKNIEKHSIIGPVIVMFVVANGFM